MIQFLSACVTGWGAANGKASYGWASGTMQAFALIRELAPICNTQKTIKSQMFTFFALTYSSNIWGLGPAWAGSSDLRWTLVLKGEQERQSLGKQIPVPGIATWRSCPYVLQKCSKVRRELWRLKSLESGSCSQLVGGRLTPLFSLCKTLHLRQLVLGISG